MFGLWKRKTVKDPAYYKSRFDSLARELIPPMNQADTKQGELVRCFANLADKSDRNGNANWDEGNEEEIEYLLSNLPDGTFFDVSACKQIESDLDAILKAGRSGHGEGEDFEEHFSVEKDVFNRVMMRVVDWCDSHTELIELNPPDPNIKRFEK